MTLSDVCYCHEKEIFSLYRNLKEHFTNVQPKLYCAVLRGVHMYKHTHATYLIFQNCSALGRAVCKFGEATTTPSEKRWNTLIPQSTWRKTASWSRFCGYECEYSNEERSVLNTYLHLYCALYHLTLTAITYDGLENYCRGFSLGQCVGTIWVTVASLHCFSRDIVQFKRTQWRLFM